MFTVKNNTKSKLSLPIIATDTTVKVDNVNGFPTNAETPFLATIRKIDSSEVTIAREIVKVTAVSTNFFTIERAFGTCPVGDTSQDQVQVAYDFDKGDIIELNAPAELIKELQDEIEARVTLVQYNSEKQIKGVSSTGTDAYQITASEVTAYVNMQTFKVQVDVANTDEVTFEVNSLGPKPVKNIQGTEDLETGEWGAGGIGILVYNATLDVFQFTGQEAIVALGDGGNLLQSFTAGENILQGEVVDYAKEILSESLLTYVPSPTTDSTWGNSTYQKVGQTFTATSSGYLNNVKLKVGKRSSPTDNVVVKIYTTYGGALLATSDEIVGSTLPSFSVTQTTFTFSTPFIMENGSSYFIELSRTGAIDATNNYLYRTYNGAGTYPGGIGVYWTGSSWNTNWRDADFEVSTNEITGYDTKIYVGDQSNQGAFLHPSYGFAQENINDTEFGSVLIDGVDKNQTGLTDGEAYYLQNDGSISATPGSESVFIGYAYGTTSIRYRSKSTQNGIRNDLPITRDVTYTAETDGIVQGYVSISNNYVSGYRNGSLVVRDDTPTNAPAYASISYLVKKGDTYQVTTESTPSVFAFNFVELINNK